MITNAMSAILWASATATKDPAQNITWVPPEGGGGPNYPDM